MQFKSYHALECIEWRSSGVDYAIMHMSEPKVFDNLILQDLHSSSESFSLGLC